jgi:hypothetical protein
MDRENLPHPIKLAHDRASDIFLLPKTLEACLEMEKKSGLPFWKLFFLL